MAMALDTTKGGTILGFCLGAVNAVADKVIPAYRQVMDDPVLQTIVLSFLGATVGFFATTFWKWVKKKFFK